MKVFSLFLFVLSGFFAIAYTPVPEQDRQYLYQEKMKMAMVVIAGVPFIEMT